MSRASNFPSEIIKTAIRWARGASRDYRAVQGEAAVESMRRIFISFFVFVPLEIALALWYWSFKGAAVQQQMHAWSDDLLMVHTVTSVVTLGLTLVVARMVRKTAMATWVAVTLQVLMCLTYLFYGLILAYFDLKVGGVSAFILVCFAVAGVSLMRPAISIALFGVTAGGVLLVLFKSGIQGSQLSIMRLNSLIAIALSVILATIIYHQYARGVLLRRELADVAGQDALTRLPNRRTLTSRLKQALAAAARTRRYGSVIFLDLDNFKRINDARGHHIGDDLLKEVAVRLLACVRETDMVARLGGDEFVVVLENLADSLNAAARQAELVTRKILGALNRPYVLSAIEHHNTPSIGVTLFSPGEQSSEELMRQADLAMYQSKDAGRNTVRFYDAGMQARMLERAGMEKELRAGIDLGQLVLHYQAQVDRSGAISGAEALVRWQHPAHGLLPPARFIPLAEEVGLIVPLGTWVLAEACAQLAAWAVQPRLSRLSLSVNVSSLQFNQSDFVGQVLDIVTRSGADPRLLKLELTESLLVANVDEVISKMQSLCERGIRISLDDFGTGYSSLSYLARLPLHQLKIDQSFVRDILEDAHCSAIAGVIIQLSQTLGLNVLAEGVETEKQRDFLVRSGCENFQGYLFSRPVPLKEFETRWVV